MYYINYFSFSNFNISELSQISEQLLRNEINNPGALTLIIVFSGGLLTSLSPCSISLLPITIAYLAGFQDDQRPLVRSTNFCSGIIFSLIILGSLSGLLGKIFGQVPLLLPKLVAILSIYMGVSLLGFVKIKIPIGPDPNNWKSKVPKRLAPIFAGLAFGLASSPCTTPVLAVLLGWIAETANPILGIVILSFFGLGQVIPLLIAGTGAAIIPNLLAFRPISKWIPPISGAVLLTIGLLNLLSEWI